MSRLTFEHEKLVTDSIRLCKLQEWSFNYSEITPNQFRDCGVKSVNNLKLAHPSHQHLEKVVNIDL